MSIWLLLMFKKIHWFKKKYTLIWANASSPTLEVFKGQAWIHIAANEPYLCTVPNKSHLSLNNPEL